MSAVNAMLPDTRGAIPARSAVMLWSAVRVIGAALLATIAVLLLLGLLFPGAIRAACAQDPAACGSSRAG